MELTARLIEQLHLEAMILSDEARGYFDMWASEARDAMTPIERVSFSCESLKVTTRLMHVVAWLLSRRSAEGDTAPPLGVAAASDRAILAQLPDEARRIIEASEELYDRIVRLDGKLTHPEPLPNVARSLMSRLERAF